MLTKIIKRDGREVAFNIEKIANAIFKAAQATGGHDYDTAFSLASQVVDYIENELGNHTPSVEEIQDAVEKILVETGHARTANKYILYRKERTRVRELYTSLMMVYEGLSFQSSLEYDV